MAEVSKLHDPSLKTKMSADVIDITPAMAAQWLENNNKNRNMNRQRISDYAAVITSGHWLESGESIIFARKNVDGIEELLDGQHRLEGCCEAKQNIVSVVVWGVDPLAFSVIDTGMRRTISQVLKINGEHYTNDLGASLSFMYGYENKAFGKGMGANGTIPTWVKLDTLDRHPELRESVKTTFSCNWVRSYGATRSVCNGIHYLGSKKHGPNIANKFLSKLNSGADLPSGDPILTLRNFLIERKLSGHRVPWDQMYSAYRGAWDSFILGQSMNSILRETDAERLASWEPQ